MATARRSKNREGLEQVEFAEEQAQIVVAFIQGFQALGLLLASSQQLTSIAAIDDMVKSAGIFDA